jgi:hypothetical protein
VSCLATVAACGGSPGGTPDAAIRDVASGSIDAALGYRVELVQQQPYVTGGRTWTITLARILRPDGGRTYVEWIPADKPGVRPLVVTTGPYTSVAWTGEALDARWATYQPEPSTLFLDHDGPAFDGTATIFVERKTPAQVASDMSPQLFNDFGALMIFGRFYAGGSVRDDVADMAAGMWFAAEQPEVDRARIGIWGGSWGGFEALFAAQQADPRARPRAVAAMYPPSDFADWVGHAQTRTGAAQTRLVPYLRRIFAATGGPPTQPGTDFTGLHVGDLCATLPPDTLALHDEHDNLVPVRETQTLVATCHAEAVYWDRTGPVDPSNGTHGPLLDEAAPQSVTTYALTYLHLRIMRSDQAFLLEFYAPAALAAHLTTVHAAQAAGRDVGFLPPRLRELCDPRVYLVDLATCGMAGCTTEVGAAVVARTVNQVWGTSYTATTILPALAVGLPPP